MRFLCFLAIASYACADKEIEVPMSDIGEGTKCDADMKTAEICLSCSRLPQDIAVQLTDCCTEDKALQFCDICTKNPEECLDEALSVENANSNEDSSVSSDYGNKQMGTDQLEKRFGRLFFGGSRGSYIYGGRGKRYGKLGMSSSGGFLYNKRADDTDIDKRYGTLHMGGSRGFLWKRSDDVDKRYGRLNIGKSLGYIYKRDNDGESRDNDAWSKDKRFGRLFIPGKRYGSLFLGRSHQKSWKK